MVRGTIFPTQVDWVQVRAVGWQEPELCACGPDGGANSGRLVAAEVVEVRRIRK